MATSNIQSKIQKLLALSNSNFEEEAKSALLKAQRLMEENGLSMEEVSNTQSSDPEVEDSEIDTGKKVVSTWESVLAMTIARNFRCQLYISRKGQNRRVMRVFGTKEDVSIALPMINFGIDSLNNCWISYRKQRENQFGKPSSRKETEMIKNTYMRSFISGVEHAFAEQVRERAIVLTSHKVVNSYRSKLGLTKESKKTKHSSQDAHATSAGFNAGKSFNSQKSIGAGKYITA